ncbi:MAG TPA: nucleoside/nucleotide kinase family protein [Acidimicrobiales bacterium]|nr:nucleoside/nucleotide kinase family protein [Acidimicrobiales bacterium]
MSAPPRPAGAAPTPPRPAGAAPTPPLETLAERAAGLAAPGGRCIVGITGPPGSGKSTLAAALVAALGPEAVLVPMDGFHLAQVELHRLGRAERKGAIDTFDAAGFVALLERLRRGGPEIVYAPAFRREVEEPIAGAIPVPPGTPVVVTEGNYLLAGEGGFAAVRGLLDEVWYLELAEEVRLERLVRRHVDFGRALAAAEAWARGTDQVNADLVAATRPAADLVVTMG